MRHSDLMGGPPDPDPTAIRADLQARVEATALYRWANVAVVDASRGEVVVAMDADGRHLNIQGFVHGGMLAMIADVAMGLAVRSAIEPGRPHVTIDLSVQFLRPAEPGSFRAVGRAVRVGPQIAFAAADVTDSESRLIARASGTYSVRTSR